MLRRMSLSVLAALAVSLPASALELDRIEVKSGIGQPLLAEIPVVSADVSELRKLHVQLASPATFARIGLERPRGVVASLQFHLVRDAQGKPVIRVTSEAPVERDFLTFLVQVEWGGGRMVREYSLSLSVPATLGSPLSPHVELPQVAMTNSIERASEPVAIPMAVDTPAAGAATDVGGAPVPSIPLAGTVPRAIPEQDMDGQEPNPAAPSPAKPVLPAAQPPAPAAQREAGQQRASGDYGPIIAGDTLSGIASAFIDDRHTLNQAMLALLRVNPDAFIGGNINLLRRGAILRAPQPAELSRYDAAQAATMVREHIRSWREGKPAPPQPAALPPAATPGAKAIPTAKAPRVAAARLEISPGPDDATPSLPSQDEAAAGAGVDEVHASIAGAGEAQAARDAELIELRTRVSELDELQRQQHALLALRNEQLATPPAAAGRIWPWLAAAFAVLMPIAWWLGRRGGQIGSPLGDHRGQAGADTGHDGAQVDGNGPMQTTGPGQVAPALPAWHPGVRETASVAADA